jgi:hypothetical protein
MVRCSSSTAADWRARLSQPSPQLLQHEPAFTSITMRRDSCAASEALILTAAAAADTAVPPARCMEPPPLLEPIVDHEPIGASFFEAYTPTLPTGGKKKFLKKYSSVVVLALIALLKAPPALSRPHFLFTLAALLTTQVATHYHDPLEGKSKLAALGTRAKMLHHVFSALYLSHTHPRWSRRKIGMGGILDAARASSSPPELGLGREPPHLEPDGDSPPVPHREGAPGPPARCPPPASPSGALTAARRP